MTTRRGSRPLRIVRAAADLFAADGYPATGMDQIGAAAGITGPAIYRHFDSKAAILAAVFDSIIDAVTKTPAGTVTETPAGTTAGTFRGTPTGSATEPPPALPLARDPAAELLTLVEVYAGAVGSRRQLMGVFVREVHHLPAEHQKKLGERQRTLIRQWRTILAAVHPDWSPEVVRTTVHGCFGMLNALGTYDSALTDDELAATLVVLAARMLDL